MKLGGHHCSDKANNGKGDKMAARQPAWSLKMSTHTGRIYTHIAGFL
jgi:hypothetical protein